MRLLFVQLLATLLPVSVGNRVRAWVLRLAGFRIGHGTIFMGMPVITGPRDLYSRLVIGRACWFNSGVVLDLGAPVTIGDRVAMGHNVMLLTTSHRLGSGARRAAVVYTRPIVIGDGAWLGSRSIILPGITVGAGGVVGAGAVVTRDVAPNTLVGGVPARLIRELPTPEADSVATE